MNQPIRLSGGLIFSFCCVLLVLFPAVGRATVRYVNPDGLCGGNVPCYTTIQAAIDASSAGDVIQVQAGIHSPASRIRVHTSVSILGPQAGVNALPSQGSTRTPGNPATEAIIDGAAASLSRIITLQANNVVLDGLEVRNGRGDLIESETAIPTAGTVIKNCIIHDSSGDEGIQLRRVQGALITCNRVYNTEGDGINVCCGSTDAVIQFNEVHDIRTPDAAIYVYDLNRTTIEGNLVYNVVFNDGIKMGSKDGSDVNKIGGRIFNNTVHHTKQDGITVYTSNTTVECNDVSFSTSENGGIYVAFAVSNVTIRNNSVHDNTFNTAKWGNPAGIMMGTAVNTASVFVQNNNIVNNNPNGVTNKAAALLNATSNWWGRASGPSGAGPGSGDAVSTNVDFSGWLSSASVFDCPEVGRECAGEVLTLALDIKPQSCPNPLNANADDDPPANAKAKKGVVPAAILGSEDLDVSAIDVSTLRLEGVAPLRHAYEDVAAPVTGGDECECTTAGPDGFTDLTLKFDKLEIMAAIAPVAGGDVRVLTLTGQLLDGTPFQASDCVRINPQSSSSPLNPGGDGVVLKRAVPNPFNPVTRIGFFLPQEAYVELSVYDARGTLVDRLVAELKSAGEHVVEWHAGTLPSGIYFYRIAVRGFSDTQKVILLK